MADNAKQQFFNRTSCAKAKLNENFEKLTENDDFYYNIIGQDKSYKDLWFFIKNVLVFSHGQPLLRVVFQSIAQLWQKICKKNNLLLIDLSMIQLILLVELKKIDSIPINDKMLKKVKDAIRHYKATLEKRKKADKKGNEKRLARKRK